MAKKKTATAEAAPSPKADSAPGVIVGTANGLPIRRMKVSDISVADYNPREITENALEGLKNSVNTFGLVSPLVYNVRFQRLVGGHQRHKTLDPNSETDVIQVDLDEVEEKALNATLNSRAIQGDWTASISEILDDIEEQKPELFSSLALNDLRVEIPSLSSADSELPDEFPEVDETVKPKSTCPHCGKSF